LFKPLGIGEAGSVVVRRFEDRGQEVASLRHIRRGYTN
jgi:hypothetical protein